MTFQDADVHNVAADWTIGVGLSGAGRKALMPLRSSTPVANSIPPIAVHLRHEAGQNYTQALTSFRYYKHLGFWQITCYLYRRVHSLLEAGGAEWPDTSKGTGANCVLL